MPDARTVLHQRYFFELSENTRRSNLWLLDVASGELRALTTGCRNHHGTVRSQAGTRIAFTLRVPVDTNASGPRRDYSTNVAARVAHRFTAHHRASG